MNCVATQLTQYCSSRYIWCFFGATFSAKVAHFARQDDLRQCSYHFTFLLITSYILNFFSFHFLQKNNFNFFFILNCSNFLLNFIKYFYCNLNTIFPVKRICDFAIACLPKLLQIIIKLRVNLQKYYQIVVFVSFILSNYFFYPI